MSSRTNFSSIPVIDYSLSKDSSTRPKLIQDLRHALINVGFLYLSNTPVDQTVVDRLIADLPRFFALPNYEKERIAMANSPHFLGYTSLGKERTRGKADIREQIDIATPHDCRWKPGEPEYLKLWGASQVG
jgi:isopenicillin N synthase-like dioxygenase